MSAAHVIALVFYFVAVTREETNPSPSVSGYASRPAPHECGESMDRKQCRPSDEPWAGEDFATFGPYFEFSDCADDKDRVAARYNPWLTGGMSECYAREIRVPLAVE